MFLGISQLMLNVDGDETSQKANKQTSPKRTHVQQAQSGERKALRSRDPPKGGTVGTGDDKPSLTNSLLNSILLVEVPLKFLQ